MYLSWWKRGGIQGSFLLLNNAFNVGQTKLLFHVSASYLHPRFSLSGIFVKMYVTICIRSSSKDSGEIQNSDFKTSKVANRPLQINLTLEGNTAVNVFFIIKKWKLFLKVFQSCLFIFRSYLTNFFLLCFYCVFIISEQESEFISKLFIFGFHVL